MLVRVRCLRSRGQDHRFNAVVAAVLKMVNCRAMPKVDMEETVRVTRGIKRDQQAHPPGLLRIFPVGEPPSMTFHRLAVGATIIGRSEECQVAVPDLEMSRQHATIIPVDDAWHIIDKDSANGTFVGGEQVRDCPLVGGEVIRTGATLFRFIESGPADLEGEFTPEQGEMIAGPRMGQVLGLLDRAADSELSVLLVGETGTGKELAARRLHRAGPRGRGPFVAVNCGAIPENLVESQLFGHARGAFTGASSAHTGHFRAANGGTIFLDEVGELPLAQQPKLLRVLQERRVMPVGGDGLVPVDVRVVCATNRDPRAMVSEGMFRADLYARISGLTVPLPPLRRRLEDIPLLLHHLIAKHDDGHRQITVEIAEQLLCRPWTGNVRELESVVRRALLLAGQERELTPEHFQDPDLELPTTAPSSPAARHRPAAPAADPAEARELKEALTWAQGDARRAATKLGISVSQLYRRAQKHGIRPAHYRP